MNNFDEHNDELNELFREQFEHFEGDVSDSSWNNIERKLYWTTTPGFLQQKMHAVEADVNPDVWRQIEKELRPRRRVVPIWWQMGAAASVIIAIGFYWLVDRQHFGDNIAENTKHSINIEKSNPTTVQDKNILSKTETSSESTGQNVSVPDNVAETASTNGGKLVGCADCKEKKDTDLIADNRNNHPSVSTSNSAGLQIEPNSILSDVDHFIENIIDEMELLMTPQLTVNNTEDGTLERIPFMPYQYKIKQRPYGLALIGGAGGNSGTQSNSSSNQDAFETMGNGLAADVAAQRQAQFDEINYASPFRLNLTGQKGITSRLSVETGLSYSLLAAMGKNDIQSMSSKLHYLGIPLRINYRFLKKKKLEFYTTQGLLIEKGLYQSTSYIELVDELNFSNKGGIRGYQAALELGMGSNYNLGSKLGLYFQGGVSYYFKKNAQQPYNIYNTASLWPSFVLGLRYKMK